MWLSRRTVLRVPPRSAFAGFRFPPEVIVLSVRWYLRFGLSYRDVDELLAERGIDVDHVTVHRWVRRFAPLLADAARFALHRVGGRWHMDETHVKVAGRWGYLYRAVDQFGQVVRHECGRWCRYLGHRMRCCVGDGVRSFGAVLQGEASNHRRLRRLRAVRGERCGKGVGLIASGVGQEGE